jgi:hypothetical protein
MTTEQYKWLTVYMHAHIHCDNAGKRRSRCKADISRIVQVIQLHCIMRLSELNDSWKGNRYLHLTLHACMQLDNGSQTLCTFMLMVKGKFTKKQKERNPYLSLIVQASL